MPDGPEHDARRYADQYQLDRDESHTQQYESMHALNVLLVDSGKQESSDLQHEEHVRGPTLHQIQLCPSSCWHLYGGELLLCIELTEVVCKLVVIRGVTTHHHTFLTSRW